jgi:hypothetical protein
MPQAKQRGFGVNKDNRAPKETTATPFRAVKCVCHISLIDGVALCKQRACRAFSSALARFGSHMLTAGTQAV